MVKNNRKVAIDLEYGNNQGVVVANSIIFEL